MATFTFVIAANWTGPWVSCAAGQTGIRALVSYTGTLGPVGSSRPLCLCIYSDPDLQTLSGCYISTTNDTAFPIRTFDTNDYYLIAFLDLSLNEIPDPGEPYEIYRERAEPPGDAVIAMPGLTDVEIVFGDEPPPTVTPPPTPTPTLAPTATASFTPPPTSTLGPCTGDCDGSGDVRIDDLVELVNIVLGKAKLATCVVADVDRSKHIEINELVLAVNDAFRGCIGAS